jgi:uncharacterized protein
MATAFILTILLPASQVYWAIRAYRLVGQRFPPRVRWLVTAALLSVYLAMLGHTSDRLLCAPNFGPQPNPTSLGFAAASLAVMQWWMFSSLLAFLFALPIGVLRSVLRLAVRVSRKRSKDRSQMSGESCTAASLIPVLPTRERLNRTPSNDRPRLPQRRHFLEHAAGAGIAVPFVASAYAMLYGRLNLEVTRKQIRLARLSKKFRGFRIAQLSDIHISAFMTEEQIRKFALIANSLHADLIVLTGDFVTWDGSAERAAVRALADLKAPFGVFGCLGNHEAWSQTKQSITSLFARSGVRILRDTCVRISDSGEHLNLIGIEPDYGWSSHLVPDGLVSADHTNILLSHYPTVFEHAAQLGIDLTLAGHTHGGQVSLNFISPRLAPTLLETPFIAGSYEKGTSQLYVNRGIGTIGPPMRAGMTPEITVFELVPQETTMNYS